MSGGPTALLLADGALVDTRLSGCAFHGKLAPPVVGNLWGKRVQMGFELQPQGGLSSVVPLAYTKVWMPPPARSCGLVAPVVMRGNQHKSQALELVPRSLCLTMNSWTETVLYHAQAGGRSELRVVVLFQR